MLCASGPVGDLSRWGNDRRIKAEDRGNTGAESGRPEVGGSGSVELSPGATGEQDLVCFLARTRGALVNLLVGTPRCGDRPTERPFIHIAGRTPRSGRPYQITSSAVAAPPLPAPAVSSLSSASSRRRPRVRPADIFLCSARSIATVEF